MNMLETAASKERNVEDALLYCFECFTF